MVNIKDLFQKGYKYHQAGNLAAAATFYLKILNEQPEHIDTTFLTGTLHLQQGNFDAATVFLKKTIALKEQGKLDEAISSHRQALSFKPDHAEAHNNLGAALQEQGKLDEAISSYRQALSLKPEYAEAYYNLGNALKIHGKTDEAIKSYNQAIRLKPDYAMAYGNLGTVLQEQGKLEEAVASHRRALSLKPDYAEARNNLGAALQEQGKLNEAVANYEKAIKLKPDYAEAHMNKSFTLLLSGNFERGWSEYEWRLRTKNFTARKLQHPLWDGSPLKGKTILVHTEQGFGDTIQFIRYLPMVRARGGYVILECQESLSRLLANCAGYDETMKRVPGRGPDVEFEVHVPLLSLPRIFGTTMDTIPAEVPFFTVDSKLATQWGIRFSNNKDFKIGIVWAGRSTYKYDHRRSCSLSNYAPLVGISHVTFYSLQKGSASVEALNPPKNMKLINLEDELDDFTDTAAVIANLDMVISVDTAVAHLAGAIGKTVWTLLPFVPDWRWQLKRDDSPWYPSMRLFRQTKPDDWSGVFEHVRKALISPNSIFTKGN